MFQLTLGPGLPRGAPGASASPGYATADFDKGIASGVSQLEIAKETKSGTAMSIVEFSVKCKNLLDRDVTSRSDPMCVFYLSEGTNTGPWKFIGRSERVMNTLSPEFLTKFKASYLFEQVQYVKFEVYDVDNDHAKYSKHDFLGSCVMTVGEIVGAFGSTVHKMLTMDENWPYKSHGSIIVAAHEVSEKSEPVLLQFRAKSLDRKDFLGRSDPFFQFYRVNDDTSRILLHRSEVIEHELNPVWKPFKVQMSQIADNKRRILEVVCFDYDQDGRHDIIGSFQTTYEKLICGPGQENIYEAINGKKVGKKGYKNSGIFELTRIVNLFPAHSFLDYIRGGTQIHFTVAIDFSRPRNSRDPAANPHRLRPRDNEYYMALKAVGEIVQDYDSGLKMTDLDLTSTGETKTMRLSKFSENFDDKLFPALACGAKIPPHMHESHDFSLNFQPDSQCRGVDGLLEAYQKAASVVEPASTARFSNIITQMSKIAQSSASIKAGVDYFILLILSSGAISDIRQTITAIIDASSLPLSIIIVGVGKNDFETMERLDADRKRLSLNNKKAERDIVQFVEFDKIKRKNMTNPEAVQAKLAREVLREVPRQLTSWMSKNRILPRSPIKVDGERLPVGLPSVETPSVPPIAEPMNQRKSSKEKPQKDTSERAYSTSNHNAAIPADGKLSSSELPGKPNDKSYITDHHGHHHNAPHSNYRPPERRRSHEHPSSVLDANALSANSEYRIRERRRSHDHPSSVLDVNAASAHSDYRISERRRSQDHAKSARDASPVDPDYHAYDEVCRSPAHSKSTREGRSFNLTRPSAPPVEMSFQDPKITAPAASMTAFRFPSDGRQRPPASPPPPYAPVPVDVTRAGHAIYPSDRGVRPPAPSESTRFSSHSSTVSSISSSTRFGDPFNGPSTMMHFDTSGAATHFGTPPVFRATDFTSRPYDAAMSHRYRSQSARDYRYHGDLKDPYAGHYY